MNDKPETPRLRPALWRVILDSLKKMLLVIGGIAILIAAVAAIFWGAPYGWALWVALAKSMSLNGNPWILIASMAASPFFVTLGSLVVTALHAESYQGEPSPGEYWIVCGIFAMGVICYLFGLAGAQNAGLFALDIMDMGLLNKIASLMTLTIWMLDIIILLFFGMVWKSVEE